MICEIHESLVWSSIERQIFLGWSVDATGEVDSSASLKPSRVRYYRSPGHAASILAKRGGRARRGLSWWRQTLLGHPFLSPFHTRFSQYIYIFFFFFLFLSISLDRAFTTHGFLNEEFIPFLLSTTSNKPPPRILPHGRSNEQSLEPGGEWKFMKSWIIRSVWGKRRIHWSTGRECWMEYRWKIQVFRGGANQSMGIKYSHDSRV